MAYVVDLLERHSRLHPGQKNVSDLKYIRLNFTFKYGPQPKPKDHHSSTTSSEPTTSCPRCISCTHWMLMESACTHSTKFVIYHPTALSLSLTLPLFGQVQAGEVTKSAHPARFSPDDKYSRKAILLPAMGKLSKANRDGLTGHRVTLKKRYGLLLTQNSG